MKRIAVIAGALVALVALIPAGTASANCAYTANQTVSQPVGTDVTVYADSKTANGILMNGKTGGGQSGDANASAGVCVYNAAGVSPDPSIVFHGGTVEAGEGTNADNAVVPGVYAVVNGDNTNIDPLGSSDGYIGVSNWETSPPRGTCGDDNGHGANTGSGTNSGGCFAVKGQTPVQIPPLVSSIVPIPTLVCGNQTGDDWYSAGRDGCAIP